MEYVPAEGIDGANDHEESQGTRSTLRRPWPSEAVRYKVQDPFMEAEDAAYTAYLDRSHSGRWSPKVSSDNQLNTFAGLGLRSAGSAARGTYTLGRHRNVVRAATQRKVAVSQAIVAGLLVMSATSIFCVMQRHNARHRRSHRIFLQNATAVSAAESAVPSITALEVALLKAVTAEDFLRAHELKVAIAAAMDAEADRKAAMRAVELACAQACVAHYVTTSPVVPHVDTTNNTSLNSTEGVYIYETKGSEAHSRLWANLGSGAMQFTCQALCIIDSYAAFAMFDAIDGVNQAKSAALTPSHRFIEAGMSSSSGRGSDDIEFAPEASVSFWMSALWTHIYQASLRHLGYFDGAAAFARTLGWIVFLTIFGWLGLVLLLVVVLVVLGMIHTIGVAVRNTGDTAVAKVKDAVARLRRANNEISRNEADVTSLGNDGFDNESSRPGDQDQGSRQRALAETAGGMTPEDALAFLGYGAEWLGNAVQAWLGRTLLAVLMALVRKSGLDAALHLESLIRRRHNGCQGNDNHDLGNNSSYHGGHHHYHNHHDDNGDDTVDVDDCATTALRLQGADHRGIADGGKRLTILSASCNLGGLVPTAGSLSTWFPATPAYTDIVAIGICEEPYLGNLLSQTETDGSDYDSESHDSSRNEGNRSSSKSDSNSSCCGNGSAGSKSDSSSTQDKKDLVGIMLAVHMGDIFVRVAECRAPHAR